MSQRVTAIEYIRGIAMLGVLGIHTGAHSLANPDVNIHLFALLEIASRFSVPIFFFVSAFGLFRQHPPGEPLSYGAFFRRRTKTVVIPYLVWSLLYMGHYTLTSGEDWPWSAPQIYEYLFFGLASYQLYFLVILIWFYLLMPLWRTMVPWLAARPAPRLLALLAFQIIFNYYSSYTIFPDFDNYYLNLAFEHRLSYLVLHYIFIFLLGGVCAVRYPEFAAWSDRRRRQIDIFFLLSLAGILAMYYFLLKYEDYPPVQAVNTVHQLNPLGVVYTLAACLFWFRLFNRPLSAAPAAVLTFLARHSYAVYLFHPIAMYYLIELFITQDIALTVPAIIIFYTATLFISLAFAAALEKAAAFVPFLGIMLTGAAPGRRKTKTKPGT